MNVIIRGTSVQLLYAMPFQMQEKCIAKMIKEVKTVQLFIIGYPSLRNCEIWTANSITSKWWCRN